MFGSCWQTLMDFGLFADFQQCKMNQMKALAIMHMFSRITHVPERTDVGECLIEER